MFPNLRWAYHDFFFSLLCRLQSEHPTLHCLDLQGGVSGEFSVGHIVEECSISSAVDHFVP